MIAIIILLLSVSTFALAQEKYEYTNADFFKGKAIVFTEDYSPPHLRFENLNLFTPTENEIILAEKIFIENFNEVRYDKKKYRKHNRQYIGYVNEEGQRIIMIHLLNFQCKRKALEHFEGWEDSFIIGFGEFYEKNMISYCVDLKKETVRLC